MLRVARMFMFQRWHCCDGHGVGRKSSRRIWCHKYFYCIRPSRKRLLSNAVVVVVIVVANNRLDLLRLLTETFWIRRLLALPTGEKNGTNKHIAYGLFISLSRHFYILTRCLGENWDNFHAQRIFSIHLKFNRNAIWNNMLF